MGGPNEMLIQARQCQEFVIGAQLLQGLLAGEWGGAGSQVSAVHSCLSLPQLDHAGLLL